MDHIKFYLIVGLKMPSNLSVSVLVISDLTRFVSIKSFWDNEINEHVDYPIFYSGFLEDFWKFNQKFGWCPLLMVFLSSNKIIGFAPLLLKSRFGFRSVSNFDHYTCLKFFSDNKLELCMEKMIDILHNHLNCASFNITFKKGSTNQKMFEKVCKKTGLKYKILSQGGQAIIPINTSLELFRSSLDKKVRKELRRRKRKLDRLGSWRISCSKLDKHSIEKIWAVERFSWKNGLNGKSKALKDWGLEFFLSGSQKSRESGGFFNSEVWFLDLDNEPIAYMLILKRNRTVFFVKTSYDLRFKSVSPGRLLTNDLVERVFMEQTAEKIDFISNLPIDKDWNPLVKNRITINIERNPPKKFLIFVYNKLISKFSSNILNI